MSSIEKAMEKLQSHGASAIPKTTDPAINKKLVQETTTAEAKEEPQQQNGVAPGAEKENTEDLPIVEEPHKKDQADTETSTTVKSDEHDLPLTSSADNPLINKNFSPIQTEPEHKINESNYFEIDLEMLTKKGFVTQESEDNVLREQFRAIKRKVLKNAFGNISRTLHHPNLVIVSSCNPHEGKTFSAINLALNIALEQDKKVLLVDADIVRPSVANRFGMEQGNGLTEFLEGSVKKVSDIIFNTNIDKFKFIPAGKPHKLSTEFLASERMVTLAQELATRYPDRIVILDSPPMLGVNETHVLANLVGQALIVVVENQTKITDIQATTEQLDKDTAVGFVINKSKRKWNKQYGYGYGAYGYGPYGHDQKH